VSARKVRGVLGGPSRADATVEVSIRERPQFGRLLIHMSKGARESKQALGLALSREEARELMRALQAACDRLDKAAYAEHKAAQAQERADAELELTLESIRKREEVDRGE
jgi:hypothetical protein